MPPLLWEAYPIRKLPPSSLVPWRSHFENSAFSTSKKKGQRTEHNYSRQKMTNDISCNRIFWFFFWFEGVFWYYTFYFCLFLREPKYFLIRKLHIQVALTLHGFTFHVSQFTRGLCFCQMNSHYVMHYMVSSLYTIKKILFLYQYTMFHFTRISLYTIHLEKQNSWSPIASSLNSP